MPALKTPPGILVTIALLALYAAYAMWIAGIERSPLLAAAGIVAAIACVGAARLRPWSQYFVYLLSAGFVGVWSYSVYAAMNAGYFELFDTPRALAALAPGAVLVGLSCVCSAMVFAHFRAAARAARLSVEA